MENNGPAQCPMGNAYLTPAKDEPTPCAACRHFDSWGNYEPLPGMVEWWANCTSEMRRDRTCRNWRAGCRWFDRDPAAKRDVQPPGV